MMKKFKQSYVALLREVTHYDIVSFDIFDTAIHRILTNPEDVFIILGQEFGLPNFRQLRIEAEKKARDKAYAKTGRREVSLREIYTEFNRISIINIDEAVLKELKVEKNVCFANPYIKYIYDCLKGIGKKVIFTSNMYLNQPLMVELLAECGYKNDDVFVSCDYCANKRDGSLFKVIRKKFKDRKIIHIGDDYEADVEGANKEGIQAHQYMRATKLNRNPVIGKASYLGSSIYNAIVNNYLNNNFSTEEEIKRSTIFKHGFKYGGPFILGYLNFIHNYAKQNNIEKICFLARDGDFLQQAYRLIFNKYAVENEYVLWSRRTAMNAMPSLYMADIFDSVIVRRINRGIKLSYLEACERLGITGSREEVLDQDINTENIITLKEDFLSQSNKLENSAKEVYEATVEYLKGIFSSCKRILLVDIGWRASGALSIKHIAHKANIDVELTAMVAGNYIQKTSYDAIYDKTGFIKSYLFSDSLNREIADDFQKNIERLVPLIEVFCASSLSPSFIGFEKKTKKCLMYRFDVPEVENYRTISLIHTGEIEFIKEYIKKVQKIGEIGNLRGNDVYWFLKNALNNKTLISDLSSYTYPRFVSDASDRIKIDSLGDFWK